jgi:hypothetical protein
VRGVGPDIPAVATAAPVEFHREHQLRQLGDAVAVHRLVAALGVGVGELEVALGGGDAADGDHPRGPRRAQQRQQVTGQGEVPEVVRTEL